MPGPTLFPMPAPPVRLSTLIASSFGLLVTPVTVCSWRVIASPRRRRPSVTGLDRIVEEGRRAREEHVRPGEKFTKLPAVAEANVLACKAGWNYGETTGKVTA